MSTEILSYADEILSVDEPMSRKAVKVFLQDAYKLDCEQVFGVLTVLEGEGYFDDV